MHATEQVTFTNMCLIRRGGMAAVQRRVDPGWPGLVFPGGHVEAGESFTDAVIREVREETGLTIINPRLCGVKNWYHGGSRYVVLLYIASDPEGELISSAEGEVRWMTIDDMLASPDLASGMAETVQAFLREDVSELIYEFDGDASRPVLK